MALLTYEGKLLRPLTNDVNCCCGEIDCTPCCAKLIGGFFEDNVFKFLVSSEGTEYEVTVTTASGGRKICDDDAVTVDIEILSGDAPYDVSVSWDPLWEYLSHSPPESVDSQLHPDGFVSWTDEDSTDYSVELRFDPCLSEAVPGLGAIGISVNGATLVLEVDMCPGSVDCCEVEESCEPCCLYLEGGVYDADDDVFKFMVEDGEWWAVIEVVLSDPAKKLQCEGATLGIKIKLGTRNPDRLNNKNFDVDIEFLDWSYLGASPNPPDASPAIGSPGTVVWSDRDSIEYTLDVAYTCINFTKGGPITISINESVSGIDLGTTLLFTECPHSCNCCCHHCCDDCHFPVDALACEDCEGGIEVGGRTEIVNLKTEVTASAPAFCDPLSTEGEFNQVGPSLHPYSCTAKCPGSLEFGCCPQSATCGFFVDSDVCGSGTPDFRIAVNYVGAGIWEMSVSGIGYLWWVTGVTSYTGDCNGATASGTFTTGGITYNWTTSFEVNRQGADDTPCQGEEEEEP
jgi:hypothetical protein